MAYTMKPSFLKLLGLNMKKFANLILLSLCSMGAQAATTQTITFNDVPVEWYGSSALSGEYAGFNWNSFSVVDPANLEVQNSYSHYRYPYYTMLNNSKNAIADNGTSFSSGVQFKVNGFDISGFSKNYVHVTLTGYKGGHQVASEDFVVSADANAYSVEYPYMHSSYVVLNWGYIDQLSFQTSGGIDRHLMSECYPGSAAPSCFPDYYIPTNHPQIVLDNLSVTTVPVPAAFGLLASGLVGLGALRRKLLK